MNVVPTESPATNPDTVGTTGEEVDHQRAAIAALGHELRALVDATVRTAAPSGDGDRALGPHHGRVRESA